MPKIKPRHKRRIFWIFIAVFAAIGLSLVIVPPFITMNRIRPSLENAIFQKTGISAKINGNINFSLLNGATIVAHDISVPNGSIKSVQLSIPLTKIFDTATADLSGKLFVYGANIGLSSLVAPKIDNEIEIENSVFRFMDSDYNIINGTIENGMFIGTVRLNGHKYDFDSNGDEFHITNKNNGLEIYGHLYSDGTANGNMSIDTKNPNELFGFSEPRIGKSLKMTCKFEWDGRHKIRFFDMNGGDFKGEINIDKDGQRQIKLKSDNINFDLSFLLQPNSIFFDTEFDIDFHGNIKLGNKIFKHLKIDAIGSQSRLTVNKIIADDTIITGGQISAIGAENLGIKMNINNNDVYCLFSGNLEKWECSEFQYGSFFGTANVRPDYFEIDARSDDKMPEKAEILKILATLGNTGFIKFKFADAAGTIELKNSSITPHYDFVKNKTLMWLGIDLGPMPDNLKNQTGDITWTENEIFFQPNSGRTKITIGSDYFSINGIDIKDWFKGVDLHFMPDKLAYTISGNYSGRNISNLKIKIAGHLFTGTAIGNNITLKTDLLNFDTFVDQEFIDNFQENQFLTGEPLVAPFNLGINLSLTADIIIYNGNQFTNFVYALKSADRQDFSITDNMHGNMLTSIVKDKNNYGITLQLNRFEIPGKMLSNIMPINIEDTTLTAQADFNTSGKIAYDFWDNLNGNMDLSFDGGILTGMGIDNFYSNSENITVLNAENILSNSIEGGKSKVKKMRIIGKYNHGDFTSTKPFVLSMHRADAVGKLQIQDGRMSVDMNMLMRGTSPSPDQISIKILPNGQRVYSLSEIMKNFDPDFLRDFSKTHDKF